MTKNEIKKPFRSIEQKKAILKRAIQDHNVAKIRNIIKQIHETDSASFVESLDLKTQIFLLRSLDAITASEIFNELNPEVSGKIINAFSSSETKKIISPLYSDDIVELIEDLPSPLVTKVLQSTSKEQRKDINYILNYHEGTVGYEMSVNFTVIKMNHTVADAINTIYEQKEDVKINEDQKFYYVLDDKGVLIGFVSSTKLLQIKNQQKLIAEIVETDVISVRAFDTTNKAADKIRKYSLTELPVVDRQNKLVGILTGEETLQLLKEDFASDIDKQAGIIQDPDKKYFEIGIWRSYLSRIPWLLITLFITTISQILFSVLVQELNLQGQAKYEWFKFVFPFIPFMLTIVGNIAIQSTTVIIKGLTLEEIDKSRFWRVLNKEVVVSVLVGATILFFNLPRTLVIEFIINKKFTMNMDFWKNFANISAIIVIAVILAVFFASSLPILAKKFGYDPALMSSPLLTTIVDLFVTGVAVGFSYLIFLL